MAYMETSAMETHSLGKKEGGRGKAGQLGLVLDWMSSFHGAGLPQCGSHNTSVDQSTPGLILVPHVERPPFPSHPHLHQMLSSPKGPSFEEAGAGHFLRGPQADNMVDRKPDLS